jgi:hypothetical protein
MISKVPIKRIDEKSIFENKKDLELTQNGIDKNIVKTKGEMCNLKVSLMIENASENIGLKNPRFDNQHQPEKDFRDVRKNYKKS